MQGEKCTKNTSTLPGLPCSPPSAVPGLRPGGVQNKTNCKSTIFFSIFFFIKPLKAPNRENTQFKENSVKTCRYFTRATQLLRKHCLHIHTFSINASQVSSGIPNIFPEEQMSGGIPHFYSGEYLCKCPGEYLTSVLVTLTSRNNRPINL